jgi:UDP-glucuronate 4-epimerase
LSSLLLADNYQVIGLDNLNSYYDVQLKQDRLALLTPDGNFIFHQADLADKPAVDRIFARYRPDYVLHLAAQAGVRYSINNPYVYLDSNLAGFLNILEACRHHPVKHLLYASSSSVYGGNRKAPFKTSHHACHPVSLYAATKRANELMAHTYSHLYGIPTTGLRFFTVYGPWGRPDMAYFAFTRAIYAGQPVRIFNHGRIARDFTYIDDAAMAVFKLLDHIPAARPDWDEADASTSFAPYRLYNIGNSRPVELMKFVSMLEEKIGRQAEKIYLEMQPGDVLRTCADVSVLEREIGFKPDTDLETGLERFVSWYKEYYRV